MDKPHAPSKPVWYLIVAAIVLELSAFLPALLLSFFWNQFVRSPAAPFEGRSLLIELAKLFGFATVLFGNYILGGVIGQGNVRSGLGDQPISRRATFGLMVAVIVAYAILWDVIHYFQFRDLVRQQFVVDESSPWLSLTHAFFSVLLAPLSEEFFFRGWLWTGLRKHWGALTTGALTGAVWLALHPAEIWVWFFPIAVILSVARHFGESVRGPIALHMLYSFVVLISPLVLNAAGLL
jgi:membrane protease YdiL (CAAX protease family)